jgi:transcriptional regulator with XRE-family HTH domain
MSQRDLAKRLGIGHCDLSKIENGWYSRVPVHVQAKLLKVFGPEWTFDALMQEVAEPTPPAPEETPGESEAGELRKAS